MNYLEGLRRLTLIISIITASITLFIAGVDNATKREYAQLSKIVKDVRLKKELLPAYTPFIKNYVDGLTKDPFPELRILTVKENSSNDKFRILWRKGGLPKEAEIESILKSELCLVGDYEKETARILLSYLAGFHDLNSIDSQLFRIRVKSYLIPLMYSVGSFLLIWIVFYCSRYIVVGFKKEKSTE
jgi:hypothetical protein